MEGLRGHVSGLGVPTYVIDGLHGAGKIPVMPNYLVSASDNAVVLRNYEGMLFRYAPEDHHEAPPAPIATTGVSNLLSGDGNVLMPEGNARMRRRKQNVAARSGAGCHGERQWQRTRGQPAGQIGQRDRRRRSAERQGRDRQGQAGHDQWLAALGAAAEVPAATTADKRTVADDTRPTTRPRRVAKPATTTRKTRCRRRLPATLRCPAPTC